MNEPQNVRIEEWPGDGAASVDSEIEILAEILHAVVHGGAGVSFFIPFSMDEARVFWIEKVLPPARDGKRRVLVARLEDRIVGTVQLDIDTPPNQKHRASLAKLLVHPNARRLGIGKKLMVKLEELARSEGKTLLTLDTVSGCPAEFLYRSLGYETAGVIPGYARAALTPDLEDATFMYKQLP
jgi:ribosomal protein S18 acetylase RimI-like enzyme